MHVLGEEEEDGGEEDGLDSTVREPGPKVSGRTVSEAQLARRLTKGKNTRRLLSNKPQDFQVGRARVPGPCLTPQCPDPAMAVTQGGSVLWAVAQLVIEDFRSSPQ